MKALGIAHLTALQLPPAELARQAAAAGFSSLGLRLHPAVPGGVAYPLAPGGAQQAELARVLQGEGMRLNDIEFIALTPHLDLSMLPALLDSGARLGAVSLTVSGDDPEAERLAATFAAVCEQAAAFGLRVNLEFMRWRVVGNLQQAVAVLQAAAQANSGLLLDALHLFRAGNTVEQLAAVPAHWLQDVQLCDAPLAAPADTDAIIREAREGRLAPGDGELPLGALLAALPSAARVGVEVPMADGPARLPWLYAKAKGAV